MSCSFHRGGNLDWSGGEVTTEGGEGDTEPVCDTIPARLEAHIDTTASHALHSPPPPPPHRESAGMN